MKNKRLISFSCLYALLLGGLFSYLSNNGIKVEASKSSIDKETSMSNVAVASGEELDKDNIIFDDFESGLDSSMWAVSQRKWGNEFNSGVRHENVFYNSYDGSMSFRALGAYYSGNEFYNDNEDAYTTDGTYTGGCLVSKEEYGPGRYEIRMKLAPIPGVCSAFWIYNAEDDKYTEIDIEFPSRQWDSINEFNRYRFDRMICSTYISDSVHTSEHIAITNNGQPVYLNDNEYHDYAFEWYQSDNNQMVKWFVDGKHVESLYSNIPQYSARIWVGCWVPNNQHFVGLADFDTAYMDVDWVKFTPFKNQNHIIVNHPLNYIYSGPISTQTSNRRNFLPNDGFKYNSLNGYKSYGTGSFDISSAYAHDASYGVKVIGSNITARTDFYVEGLKTAEFAADYQGYGNIKIYFTDETNNVLDTIALFDSFSPGLFTHASKVVSIPSGAKKASVRLETESSETGMMVDNLFFGYRMKKSNNGSSYGVSSKTSIAEPIWGENSINFTGESGRFWRILNGNPSYSYNKDLNTILLTKSSSISYPDGTNPTYSAINQAMVNNDLFNLTESNNTRFSLASIIQEFDMTYFEDIEFDFYSLTAYNSWRKLGILYSIDSGASWNSLVSFSANITPSGHATFKYSIKATKSDLAVDYDTIRFAFYLNMNPDLEEDGCRLTSIIINNSNDLRYNLDNDDVCHASDNYIEFIYHQYDLLTASEKQNFFNDKMSNINLTYQEGFDYLSYYWETHNSNNSAFTFLIDSNAPEYAVIIAVSLLSLSLILIISKKIIYKKIKK